ncbi:13315_t:CDS:1, partial [Racocetra persica]
MFFDPSIKDELGKKARYKQCLGDYYLTVNNSGTSNLRSYIINIHKISIPSNIDPE